MDIKIVFNLSSVLKVSTVIIHFLIHLLFECMIHVNANIHLNSPSELFTFLIAECLIASSPAPLPLTSHTHTPLLSWLMAFSRSCYPKLTLGWVNIAVVHDYKSPCFLFSVPWTAFSQHSAYLLRDNVKDGNGSGFRSSRSSRPHCSIIRTVVTCCWSSSGSCRFCMTSGLSGLTYLIMQLSV